MSPAIVISLDFELRWGLLDILGEDAARYRNNLEGVREVVPRLLELFGARDVRATWATVGSVACESWDEWNARAPTPPQYTEVNLRFRDGYRRIDPGGRLHFAPDLVRDIARAPGQELASHTFSHVYLREPGFTRDDAARDTDAMVELFRDRGLSPATSFVFPRNQVAHTDVLRERGIEAWRENPTPFYWQSTTAIEQSRTARALRLSDAFLPLGRRAAPAEAQQASYFVRMGLPRPAWNVHRARIRREARRLRQGEALHLWWHPHNLGDAPAAKTARIGELIDDIRDAAPTGTEFLAMRDLAQRLSQTPRV
jgi:hypothetical protein